jgi:hypothetical protein
VLLALVLAANKLVLLVPIALVGGTLLYGFRLPYMFLTVLAGAYVYLARGATRMRLMRFVVIGVLGLALLSGTLFVDRYYSSVRGEYNDQALLGAEGVKPLAFNTGPVSPLKRLVLGLLTPFPWTQPFELGPQAYGQIPEYAQATLTLALIIVIVRKRRHSARVVSLLQPSAVFALLWMFSGIGGAVIHAGYVQVGSAFLLPYAMPQQDRPLRSALRIVLLAMLVGNAVWLLIRFIR